jgi:hypothetical protein
MPLNFKPASQNGAVPPTPAKYKQSKLGLIASTTTSVLGQPIIVKALSDAAYYKTTPVTLYAFNPSTNQTIATTSSFIDTVQAPFVLNNLPDGQWQLWAEWPGDGPFVAKSTQANLINLTINTAVNTGGRLTLIPSPASGSLVAGEGTATFFATITNLTSFLSGSLLFYDGNQQIGSVVLNQNHASFSTDQLTAGTHNITVQWPGGLIGGTRYQGFSTSTNYAISSGTVSGTTLNLTVSPNHGVFQEGYITLTASLINGAANYPGSVVFYRNGVELYTAPVLGTTATYTYRNFEAVGPTEFKALWDGNSTGHPRFIPVASSIVSWTVAARETPSLLSVAVVPNPTAFSAPTYFTATFHQLAGEPLVPGEVVFYADDIVVGRAPIINDVATTSNRYIMTGTHAVYAYYAGSANEPKFYSTRSETVSLLVKEGLNLGAPLTLTVTNDSYQGTTTPYVKGETQKFTANITTSRQMTGLVYFAINGIENFSAPWVNNSATTTTVFDNSGTYAVQAIWHGGDIGDNFYASTSSVITNITVLDGYTLTQPITLSESQVRVINEPLTVTAAVTTSSGMRGTMTFYANALALGTAQWNSATNQAVLTTTAPVSSGTYTISALWSGGYLDDSRLYVGKTANTSTIFVDAAQHPIIFTLNVGENPIITNTQTVLTATIIGGSAFNDVGRGLVRFTRSTTTASIIGTTATTSTIVDYGWNIQGADYNGDTTHYDDPMNTYHFPYLPWVINYAAWVELQNTTQYNVGDRLTINGEFGPASPVKGIVSPSYPITKKVGNFLVLDLSEENGLDGSILLENALPGSSSLGTLYTVNGTGPWIGQVPYEATIGTSTFVNNLASIIVATESIPAGTNNITASYSGTGVVPKYYPASSSTNLTIIGKSNTTLSANAPTFFYHNLEGGLNSLNAYTYISLTGDYATHQPTGPAKLYEGVTLLSSIADVKTNQTFSWNPFNQLDSGTRTLIVQYLGDVWNNSSTVTTSFIAATRRNTTMTLSISTSNAVSLNPLTFYIDSTPTINVKNTSTYFNGQTIQFYSNNNLIGNAPMSGQTSSIAISSMSLSTGTYIMKGIYGGDFAYNSTVTNTSSFNIIKHPVTIQLGVSKVGPIFDGHNQILDISATMSPVPNYDITAKVVSNQGYTGSITFNSYNGRGQVQGLPHFDLSPGVFFTVIFDGDAIYNSATSNQVGVSYYGY